MHLTYSLLQYPSLSWPTVISSLDSAGLVVDDQKVLIFILSVYKKATKVRLPRSFWYPFLPNLGLSLQGTISNRLLIGKVDKYEGATVLLEICCVRSP